MSFQYPVIDAPLGRTFIDCTRRFKQALSILGCGAIDMRFNDRIYRIEREKTDADFMREFANSRPAQSPSSQAH